MKYKLKTLRKVNSLLIVIRIYCDKLNKYQRFLFFLKWSIRFIFFGTNVNLKNGYSVKNKNIITIYQPLNRPDLQKSFPILPTAISIPIERIFSFRLIKTFLLIKMIFIANFQFNKLLFGITVLELKEIYDKITEFMELKNKKFLFYNEKQYWEGLWCIALEMHLFSTLSFTHGFYRDTGRVCSVTNTNPFNYLYQISKTQICWGQIQKATMSKYDTANTKYIVLGKQDLMVRTKKTKHNQMPTKNVLILDSKELFPLNKKLVSSINKIETDLLVKNHFDDKYDYGFPTIVDLDDILDDIKAFWATNSSAILQIGRAGYKVCLYKKSDFLKYIDSKYYKIEGDFFIIDQNYDWKPFIDLYGSNYSEALQKKCF